MIDWLWTSAALAIAGVGVFFYYKRVKEHGRVQGALLSEGIVIGMLLTELVEIVLVEYFGYQSTGFSIPIGAAIGLAIGQYLEGSLSKKTRKPRRKSRKNKKLKSAQPVA